MGKYSLALVFAYVFLCCVPTYAQDTPRVFNITVEGNADVIKNDAATARDGAIQDALQKAVLEAASVLLLLPVRDEKFLPIKRSEIIDQTDKYINNYKITAENNKTESYAITAKVAIGLLELKNDLAKMGFLKISRQDRANAIISLDVKGIRKYSDFSYLKEFLRKRTKVVKNFYPHAFAAQQAHLEVEIFGLAQELAEELAKTGLYVLDTKRIDKNQLEINIIQREE